MSADRIGWGRRVGTKHMEHMTAPDGVLMSKEDAESAAVVFDKVSFAFDEHAVLRDVSFIVPKGSMKILLGAFEEHALSTRW
jgi:ABC-type multidrug transport system fused ATPase/permease subunit